MSFDVPPEDLPLDQLQNVPVESVLQTIDDGLVHLPSYRELYNRWERQQWLTQDLDFISDRIQWEDMTEEERAEHLSSMAMFFQGEVSVTDALGAYIRAAQDEEMRIFLTTQQVDEARHAVFFDRFFCEVLEADQGSLEETLAAIRPYLNQAAQYILLEALTEVAERLRSEPERFASLVEGVVLYHLVIEGMMGLSGQRALLELYRQENLFPAFRTGMMALTRDESRHVLFGVRFLRDTLQRDAEYLPVVAAALEKYAPAALAAVTPPDEIVQAMLAKGEDPWKTPRYAHDSLRKKLRVVGLNIELPTLPG
jgi:ribonucleoside-diphosphate reductase beta chain